MKKIFFIIASVLCFTVSTSCNPDKDDPITEEQKPTTNPNSYKNVTKLKNFTGKDILTITTEIEAEGVLLITLKENFFITDSRYVEAVNTILTIEDEILVNDKKNLTKDDYAAFFMFCENVGFEV